MRTQYITPIGLFYKNVGLLLEGCLTGKRLSDDSFEMVISDELGQSIDQYEKALLTTNFPAIRDALSQHLSQLSGKKVRKGLGNPFTYKKMKCRCGSRSF